MTTIAYDGYDLAADSQITSGNEKVCGVQKIHEIQIKGKAHWIGLSGTTKYFKDVITWTKNPERKSEPKVNGEVDGILISCEGCVMILVDDGENISWDEWHTPVAIGSGGQFAIGAMLAGKNAKQAVNIAAKVDTLTGGPINVININPRKTRTKNKTKKEKKDGLQPVHSTRSVEDSSPAPAGRRKFK